MSVMYILKEGAAGFRRARLATLGSIITVTIALLLLGTFYIVSTNTSRIIGDIRARTEMEVFLDEPASRAAIAEVRRRIEAVPGVDTVKFVSKDDAAKIFREEFGEDIMKLLEFNPLPPSYKVHLKEKYRTSAAALAVSRKLKEIPGVDDVVYRKDVLEFIDRRTKMVSLLGFSIGALIALSAIFLVSNTIRLTIYARRKIIETMKLVGASWWFIRAPFLIEGTMQGIIGGVIATGMLYYTVTSLAGIVSHDLAEFVRMEPASYAAIILLGGALGLLGSAISVRRFIGEAIVS